jgi:hypothetical protein
LSRDFTETAFNMCSDNKTASFTTNDRSWVTKMTKLIAAHPDEVRKVIRPEDNDGVLYCQIPKTWLKISPPRAVNYTDEQRRAMGERLKQACQSV